MRGSATEFLGTGEAPRPGIRSQIAVADYDGDGKLDLLLGDFCTYVEPRGDLTPEERGELAGLRENWPAWSRLTALNAKIQEEMKAFWKPYGVKESLTPEVQAKYRACMRRSRPVPRSRLSRTR